MKKIWHTRRSLALQLGGVVILLLVLLVADAQAQVVDTDQDGFTDAEESAGIPFLGQVFVLNPAIPDLFVILVQASPSLIPSDPLQIISNLGISAHAVFGDAGVSRAVTGTQSAIMITENRSTNDTIWGISLVQGTPNTAGLATVFTQRINDKITQTYTGAGLSVPPGVIENCIRHVYAHEAGHNINVRLISDPKLGHHYRTADKKVMSQSVTITVKGSNVTVVCPSTYADPDLVDFQLN